MRKQWGLAVFSFTLLALAGCASMQKKSLYERLGGMDALKAVVDDVVARAAADERINKKFARTDIPRLKFNVVKQLCAVTGGPCNDIPRSAPEVHRNMGVTEGEFNAFVEDLIATLNKFNVPQAEQTELLGILGGLKSQIVEVNLNRTGTPLPSDFQAAPPLPASQMQEDDLKDKNTPM